jgi:hypothetical protein
VSNNKKSIVVAGLVAVSVLVGISPLLSFSIPRAAALSPQTFYPDYHTSSGCGHGLDRTIPSYGEGDYFSSFTVLFCGTANQTLTLTNSSFTVYLASAGSQTVGVTVGLSDNGTIITKSSNTPSTTNYGCIPYTYNLSVKNGGLMKSGDQLIFNITMTGVVHELAICTGSFGGPNSYAVLTLYGTPIITQQVFLTPQQCQSLLTLAYQKLAVGSTVKTLAVPSEIFSVPNVPNWYWYFVPSNGQNPNMTADQVVGQLWSSGHGQNFDFFIGTYDGNLGVILRTDYSLTYECSG